MKYFATKNQNKTEDKHPDFRIYKKDSEGNVIEGEYTKKDGTKGTGWKAFGALWCTVENGKIKSMSITIDDDVIPNYNSDEELDKLANLRPEDLPF